MQSPISRLLLCFVAAAAALPAQWSGNPAQNLAVADGIGEQVLPKLGLTRDGGCYLGWFDNRTGGYQVRLQRLDRFGNEAWAHNGIVVSANPQSTSLVDWDLICASDDSCVLTFTDTRAGGDLDVYAYRFDAAGTAQWGANGVALSNNPDFEPNPRVVEASDGDFVFTWANTVSRTLRVQRLDPQGAPRFAPDGVGYLGDTGATPGFVQMVAADAGSVILSWMRATSFSGQRHLHAMKFDALGAPVWNGGVRVALFDQASVPIAHQHRMAADGQGGAFVSWHFALGQQFLGRLHRLSAVGVELWPHNGVDVSMTTNSVFDPAMAVDPATQSAIVFWNERNLAQSAWGIGAQRLDGAGALQWGPSGIPLVPVGSVTLFAPVAAAFAGGAFGAVLEQAPGSQDKAVRVFTLDPAGATTWTGATHASTAPSDKLRLQLASTRSGAAVLAWTDLRNGPGDLFAQAIGSDASLPPVRGTELAYGCGINPANSLTADRPPAFGTVVTVAVDNPAATQAPGALPLLLLATAPAPGFPCGVSVPGFGLAVGGGPGELLLDPAALGLTVLMPPWLGPGQPSSLPFPLPYVTGLLGLSLYLQAALVDLAPAAAVPIGFTSALRWQLGY
jgi:hypothetical protein